MGAGGDTVRPAGGGGGGREGRERGPELRVCAAGGDAQGRPSHGGGVGRHTPFASEINAHHRSDPAQVQCRSRGEGSSERSGITLVLKHYLAFAPYIQIATLRMGKGTILRWIGGLLPLTITLNK